MIKLVEACERFIILALVVMMIIAVLLSTIELGWIMVGQVITPRIFCSISRSCSSCSGSS